MMRLDEYVTAFTKAAGQHGAVNEPTQAMHVVGGD